MNARPSPFNNESRGQDRSKGRARARVRARRRGAGVGEKLQPGAEVSRRYARAGHHRSALVGNRAGDGAEDDRIDRDRLRENMRYFLAAIMPVCEESGVNMCVHPDDPPFQVLGLPRIVTCENDIDWFLNAVDNPHNGLTFCAGSLSAGIHNDVPALAAKYAKRTHFVHLRSTNVMENGNFIESSHLEGRGRLIDLIRIFEKENPALPMRVDHGRLMLDDADKGYNPGYSFHGRMLALAQVEGMMAVVKDDLSR